MASSLDPNVEARFIENVEKTSRFFMGDSDLHRALDAVTRAFEEAKIPYAIAGAVALNAHGYRRATVDIDVLITREGLARFKDRYLGRGYVEKFPGSKGVRDTQYRVDIHFLIAGDYPGDGKPKPVQFPDPSVAEPGARFSLLPLAKLVELKLASGMTARHRVKDIGDVIELIRTLPLEEDFGEQLDPYVRDRYRELWADAQTAPAED